MSGRGQMGLTADTGAIVRSGRLPRVDPRALSPGPEAVALATFADYAAVMFILETRAGHWMMLMALLARARDWEEVVLVEKPWWPPSDGATGEDLDRSLLATGGHSRFMQADTEIVMIPGQADTGASLSRMRIGGNEDIDVHEPWGHFIYLGDTDEHGEPVTLLATKGGDEQTEVFARLDPR